MQGGRHGLILLTKQHAGNDISQVLSFNQVYRSAQSDELSLGDGMHGCVLKLLKLQINLVEFESDVSGDEQLRREP